MRSHNREAVKQSNKSAKHREIKMISFTIDKFTKIPVKDELSLYVQEIGGYFEIQKRVVEFFIPEEYREFMIIKYPFLSEVEYVR